MTQTEIPVPHNRPVLLLDGGPRSVAEARRWVVEHCVELGREDLAECAEMGTSELVTNAILHAEGPFELRLRGTAEHPRVEVRDHSAEPPDIPTQDPSDQMDGDPADDDPVAATDIEPDPIDLDSLDETDAGLLLTFGRGLSIVARSAVAWGADLDDEGKVVWFVPAREYADDTGPQGVLTDSGTQPHHEGHQRPADAVDVRLLEVPLPLYVGFQNHFREVRREIRLLSLAHQDEYPLAAQLNAVFDAVSAPLMLSVDGARAVQAHRGGKQVTDLTVTVSRGSIPTIDRFRELMDITDAFGREEKMLSMARSGEQRRFQNWYLGQFASQARGNPPQAWATDRVANPSQAQIS